MINSTEELIKAIAQGEMIILMDDEDRENEGDLVIAAQKVDYQKLNFILRNTSGIICLTLDEEHCNRLKLEPMVNKGENTSKFGTGFTVSIEAAKGVATGVSIADRLTTINAAIADNAQHSDLARPGHIFPIKAENGGVLTRNGHTEASIDLSVLAGLKPCAIICELMNEDGTMQRRPQLEAFAKKHNLKIGTIKDLVSYRKENELKTLEIA